MTKTAIIKRIESQANLNDATRKALLKADATFNSASAQVFVKSDAIDLTALAAIDMKAIARASSVMRFALKASDADTNVHEILRSIILHADAKRDFTLRDAETALDANAKIDAERKAIFVQRSTVFDAVKRHAQMTIQALRALNIISEKSKSVYALNSKSKLVAAIRERYAA